MGSYLANLLWSTATRSAGKWWPRWVLLSAAVMASCLNVARALRRDAARAAAETMVTVDNTGPLPAASG